jgi:hypothetical protein
MSLRGGPPKEGRPDTRVPPAGPSRRAAARPPEVAHGYQAGDGGSRVLEVHRVTTVSGWAEGELARDAPGATG